MPTILPTEENRASITGTNEGKVASFGLFVLDPAERRLERNGHLVEIGSRALDILTLLVQRAGQVVGRRELLDTVWPDLLVEESNLRVHVANLRKALDVGDQARLIANVTGRGYSFIHPVTWMEKNAAVNTFGAGIGELPLPPEELPGPTSFALGNLPRQLTRIVGRAELVADLVRQISVRRFVSVIGPGGIGKTTVALDVARRISPVFRDGVIFIDLSPIRHPTFVYKALATALGIAIDPGNATAQLVEAIGSKKILIVFDCCEHLVEPAAALVVALLQYTDNVSIMTTSREALRAEGEWIQRVPPLALPDESGALSAQAAMQSPAVQLFVDRASEQLGGYLLSEEDAPMVAEICLRLDGIALAIELAAGRMSYVSVLELREQIEDNLSALRYGNRTALPRHQTLAATLDWSYALLSEDERRVLNRLSVLQAGFSMKAATDICACDRLNHSHVEDLLVSLVAKSLVSASPARAGTQYRVLDTTRAYARRKLETSNEYEAYLRRHAEHFLGVFQKAAERWDTVPTAIWVGTYVPQIEDLRAALTWAFSEKGDTCIAVSLVLAAVPLWSQLSLVDEFSDWIARALAIVDLSADQIRILHMQLFAALGGLQMYAISTAPQARVALERSLEIATELDNQEYRLRGLRALWAEAVNSGELRRSLMYAKQFEDYALLSGDRSAQILSNRLIGTSVHYLGDQCKAAGILERMLDHYSDSASHSDLVRYQFDQRLTAQMIYLRTLWLQGKKDTAGEQAEAIVSEALSLGHTMSICNILSQCACPLALFDQNEKAARRYVTVLKEWSAPRVLDVWRVFTECYEAEVEIEFGDVGLGLKQLFRAEEKLAQSFKHHKMSFLVAATKGYFAQQNYGAARAAISEAAEMSAWTGEGWRMAELHRWEGELKLAERGDQDAAEICFRQALQIAEGQGALSWALRAATSLATLNRDGGKRSDAMGLLANICSRFTEGRHLPDFLKADTLLGNTVGRTSDQTFIEKRQP